MKFTTLTVHLRQSEALRFEQILSFLTTYDTAL
jgi:hypothetical protein